MNYEIDGMEHELSTFEKRLIAASAIERVRARNDV